MKAQSFEEIIDKCKPIYKTFKGWGAKSGNEWSEISKKGYNAIPDTMKEYIEFIQEYLQTKIAMISIGPNRSDTIELVNDIF